MSELTPTVTGPSGYQARFAELQEELLELQQRLQELDETAYSEDGTVAATVGARGELRDLRLDPRIYRTTDAKALAATIMQTIHEASDAVTLQLIELTRPLVPGASSEDIEQAFRAHQASKADLARVRS